MSSDPSWRELCLRTLFSCPNGSAANRSIEAVGMIISWLYTGATASQIQGKAVWGEVPRLLAHGRIWSSHWNGGSPACEPAGTRAELAPPPPQLHLLYAAQVFQIKLLFASFPWWLTQFACECFFSQDTNFNSPANSTRVSGFDKRNLSTSKSGTMWKINQNWFSQGTQMRSPLSTAPSKAELCTDPHTWKMPLNK